MSPLNLNKIAEEYQQEWWFMEPEDWNALTQYYLETFDNCGDILEEGTLLDTQLLHVGKQAPVFLAIPHAVTSWTSTYKVKAWNYDETPELVWEFLEASQDEYSNEDDYHNAMQVYKNRVINEA